MSELEVTQVLADIAMGKPGATDHLLPLVYHELRDMAGRKLRYESPGHTLQATALVHEAYMRLVGSRDDSWQNRAHFFGAAAEAMRRILVEYARRKKRIKRGGDKKIFSLDDVPPIEKKRAEELIALDEALNELEQVDAEKAQLVKLRFFGGMTMKECSQALDMSLRTTERSWAYARAWLMKQMALDSLPETMPELGVEPEDETAGGETE